MKKSPTTKAKSCASVAFKPARKGGNIAGLPSYMHGKSAGKSMVLRHGK